MYTNNKYDICCFYPRFYTTFLSLIMALSIKQCSTVRYSASVDDFFHNNYQKVGGANKDTTFSPCLNYKG